MYLSGKLNIVSYPSHIIDILVANPRGGFMLPICAACFLGREIWSTPLRVSMRPSIEWTWGSAKCITLSLHAPYPWLIQYPGAMKNQQYHSPSLFCCRTQIFLPMSDPFPFPTNPLPPKFKVVPALPWYWIPSLRRHSLCFFLWTHTELVYQNNLSPRCAASVFDAKDKNHFHYGV